MTTLLWTVFVLSVLWVAFAYVLYPLCLLVLARVAPRPSARSEIAPPLSVLITVRDGESWLEKKLEATLAQEYPGGFEVIVASDGSADRTDEIARSWADRGVRLVAVAGRRGKEAAQGEALRTATGEILVFTDVTAELSPGALRAIVRPFADPGIAAVSSEDEVEAESGEGAYVRLEMGLRALESRAATLIGLSGSFFAVRRELCTAWRDDLASDFRLALEAGARGLRAVAEPGARARFDVVRDPGQEWARKVRTVRRGIAVLAAYRRLLAPRHGRLALALWGHKVARFTQPFALLAALAASAALAPTSGPAKLLLGLQLAGYAAGGLALASPAAARVLPARLVGFFLLVNASMLAAWAYHLSGRRAVAWQPTQR